MIRKNWLEWVTLTISSIVVISTFGYLIWLAVGSSVGAAQLSVSLGEVTRNADLYEVDVTIRNDGGKTAENVRVDVMLETPDRETERAELTVDYLPYRSEKKGTAVFRSDPRKGQLTAVARTYEKP